MGIPIRPSGSRRIQHRHIKNWSEQQIRLYYDIVVRGKPYDQLIAEGWPHHQVTKMRWEVENGGKPSEDRIEEFKKEQVSSGEYGIDKLVDVLKQMNVMLEQHLIGMTTNIEDLYSMLAQKARLDEREIFDRVLQEIMSPIFNQLKFMVEQDHLAAAQALAKFCGIATKMIEESQTMSFTLDREMQCRFCGKVSNVVTKIKMEK